jgi:NADPH:quinone reductase-like Zn-dependent oxidoreductase
MKAIVCTKYGPPEVLQLREVEKPTPKNNEIRIKIHATAITASDCIIRAFNVPRRMKFLMGLFLGFSKPRNPILGMVLAGEVESTGKDVKRLNIGDQIFALTVMSGTRMRFGTYAEFICLADDMLIAPKPFNLSYEEAAAIPYGALLAISFLRKGNFQNCKKVLIYGASGAIGTAAIQLAKHYGAKVTGVCSAANSGLVKSLGADSVLDYTTDDVTRHTVTYDLILDAVGKSKHSEFKSQCKRLLTPEGKYISVDDGSPALKVDDLILLKELVEAGKLKPVIDRYYPLEQMVEAHRYVDKGHKKGNVVITIG